MKKFITAGLSVAAIMAAAPMAIAQTSDNATIDVSANVVVLPQQVSFDARDKNFGDITIPTTPGKVCSYIGSSTGQFTISETGEENQDNECQFLGFVTGQNVGIDCPDGQLITVTATATRSAAATNASIDLLVVGADPDRTLLKPTDTGTYECGTNPDTPGFSLLQSGQLIPAIQTGSQSQPFEGSVGTITYTAILE